MNILFQPISIGAMTIKNRFVRSATQDWLGNEDGSISEREVELYRKLAANEVGLIITAHAYVQHPLGKASVKQNAFYADKFVDGYRQVAAAVKPYGAKLILQLSHAGRQLSPDLTDSFTPLAPSAVLDTSSGITPRAMTTAEIWQLIDDFVAAVVRAKATGCDGVQLHIAHGYCLSQFISPHTNRREDEWGGCIDNRIRIVREIITRSREQVGDNFPILVKLNSTDGFSGPGYLSLDDVVSIAKHLEALGVAAIEVSGGIKEAAGVMSAPHITSEDKEAYFAGAAKAIKAAVTIPVILVGGLRSVHIMQNIVENGTADMVSLSRPFIKDPDLVRQIASGATKVGCISCNGCFNPNGLSCRLRK